MPDAPKRERELQAAEERQAEPEETLARCGGVPVSYLRSLDRLNLAIREAQDLEQMMSDVLDVVLDVMDADRAWLLYPCDPSTPLWRVPMERTRPEYPGALAQGKDLPMLEEVREAFNLALSSDDPLAFGPGTGRPLPRETNRPFHVQSQLLMALYPKLDKPWLFGIHQCSRVRIWNRTEQMLFKAMGRRMGDALGSLLLLRDLRKSEGRFRAILDFMPSAVIGVDGQGRITHFNRIAQTIFGKEFHQVTGQPLAEALPTLSGQLTGLLDAVLRERKVMRREKAALPMSGFNRLVDILLYPAEAGSDLGAVIRIDDVTERARLEEMMMETEKMMSVGGLAAGMAHEINNPLAGIVQSAQLVLSRLTAATKASQEAAREAGCDLEAVRRFLAKRGILGMIELMRESAVRAAHIVANMLEFSRRGESRLGLEDVNALLDKAVELCASDYDLSKNYDFRRIRIEREYQPDLPPVPCSRTQIEQVFLNLLRNSTQAMADGPKGGPEPCIVLRTSLEGDTVRIEVADNGPGMTEAVRNKAFEPFFTTKAVGIGTGLGLSVSYFIITSGHQGTIQVESSPGLGAKFIVRLPLSRQPS